MAQRVVDVGGFQTNPGYQPYNQQPTPAPAQDQEARTPEGQAYESPPEWQGPAVRGLLSSGGPMGTGIAEGYNKIYDMATGFDAAAAGGTNLATGTTSSGTFGGSNIANAAYAYGGGKLANELFDNKGHSDIGGSVGASIGGAVAVGGSAAGIAMGAQFGALAGPLGALGGAVIGAALGSLFGGGGISDSSFRTYSGDSTDDVNEINSRRSTEAGLDSHNGYRQLEAGAAYSMMNTFDYGRSSANSTDGKDWGSIDTPFGKYTVSLIDEGDVTKGQSFSSNWLEGVGEYDAAFATLLSPEELERAKTGLSGSVQASKEWEDGEEAGITTSDMLLDRYAQIARLAGRWDLFAQLRDGFANETFERHEGAKLVASVIEANTQTASDEGSDSGPVAERAPASVARPEPETQSQQRVRPRIRSRDGVINQPMRMAGYVG